MKKIRLNHNAVVVLAAGKSGRLGTPKQTLVYEGKTLLQRSVEAAVGTGLQPVLVVVGAHHSTMEKELEAIKGIRIVLNKGWEEGMASSIRCGVEMAMRMDRDLDGLIMMVCDQPFVTTELLKGLIQKHQETGMPVVASSYGNHTGVPAFFDKQFFKQLLLLKGDTGARKLLKDQADQVTLVHFPGGATDIDTLEDYSNAERKKERKE